MALIREHVREVLGTYIDAWEKQDVGDGRAALNSDPAPAPCRPALIAVQIG